MGRSRKAITGADQTRPIRGGRRIVARSRQAHAIAGLQHILAIRSRAPMRVLPAARTPSSAVDSRPSFVGAQVYQCLPGIRPGKPVPDPQRNLPL